MIGMVIGIAGMCLGVGIVCGGLMADREWEKRMGRAACRHATPTCGWCCARKGWQEEDAQAKD